MSVEGQDERRTVEWVATSLEAMASKLSLPHGPEFLERTVNDLLARATDVRAFGAALVESEARERELEAERDKRLLPEEAQRVKAERYELERRGAVLVEALKEAEQALQLLARKGWGGDVGEPEEIASEALTRLAALAGVVEAEPADEMRRALRRVLEADLAILTENGAALLREAEPDGSER